MIFVYIRSTQPAPNRLFPHQRGVEESCIAGASLAALTTAVGGLPAGMVFRSRRRFAIPHAVYSCHRPRLPLRLPLVAVAIVALACCCRAQSELPDAPAPNAALLTASFTAGGPALPVAGSPLPATAAAQQTFPPFSSRHERIHMPGLQPNYLPLPRECITESCSQSAPLRDCCVQTPDAFAQFLQQNAVHIYTPRELGRLAVRGVIDPFNLLTIVGTSAYTVATDAHSPYGPGGYGIAKLSGVALTQDMTNAFVETFLIPSIDHQDPRFHRMPNAPLKMRVFHCIYQPIWTDSDTGKGMFNYSTVVGAVVDEAVDAAYVPFRRVGWGAGADRISINLATTPIGNFVTEFVPDVARHINVSVVIVQRVIDRVAIEESGGTP
jgi:hypothetical protein